MSETSRSDFVKLQLGHTWHMEGLPHLLQVVLVLGLDGLLANAGSLPMQINKIWGAQTLANIFQQLRTQI